MRSTYGDERAAIHEALRRASLHGLTNQALAERAGIHASVITHLVHGQRPTAAVLRALIHAWPDPADAIAVLVAHLRDEVSRSRVAQDCIQISAGTPPENIRLAEALHELQLAAQDEQVLSLLCDLAMILRASARNRARLGAEPAEQLVKELGGAKKRGTAGKDRQKGR
jgi:transcriptional regulator with XRE-family HTH domain